MSVADFIPPAARRLLNRLAGTTTVYRGPYADWQAARSASSGYDEVQILARVRDATARVLRGEADYEQDGVALHGIPSPSPALTSLLLAASIDGRLDVLDFGGGLGSHFLRWRPWLCRIPKLSWQVIEQPEFVAAGTELLRVESALTFHTAIAEVAATNAVLASSVLQYLPDPFGTLAQLIARKARLVVLDRTPLSDERDAHVLSQHVPRTLGRASYPLWLLPRERVYARLREHYDLIAEFDSPDAPVQAGALRGSYRGCAWLRKESA